MTPFISLVTRTVLHLVLSGPVPVSSARGINCFVWPGVRLLLHQLDCTAPPAAAAVRVAIVNVCRAMMADGFDYSHGAARGGSFRSCHAKWGNPLTRSHKSQLFFADWFVRHIARLLAAPQLQLLASQSLLSRSNLLLLLQGHDWINFLFSQE